MAFVFRLEKVLSVRRLQEEAAHQRLVLVREGLQSDRARLEALEQDLRRVLGQLDELKRRDELSAEDLHLHSLHSAGQRRRIEQAREAVFTSSQMVETASADLLGAHQARQTLEKLRQREETAWVADQTRKEARRIDEVAGSRHRGREEEEHGP